MQVSSLKGFSDQAWMAPGPGRQNVSISVARWRRRWCVMWERSRPRVSSHVMIIELPSIRPVPQHDLCIWLHTHTSTITARFSHTRLRIVQELMPQVPWRLRMMYVSVPWPGSTLIDMPPPATRAKSRAIGRPTP